MAAKWWPDARLLVVELVPVDPLLPESPLAVLVVPLDAVLPDVVPVETTLLTLDGELEVELPVSSTPRAKGVSPVLPVVPTCCVPAGAVGEVSVLLWMLLCAKSIEASAALMIPAPL